VGLNQKKLFISFGFGQLTTSPMAIPNFTIFSGDTFLRKIFEFSAPQSNDLMKSRNATNQWLTDFFRQLATVSFL
jgi:hypothetical protein